MAETGIHSRAEYYKGDDYSSQDAECLSGGKILKPIFDIHEIYINLVRNKYFLELEMARPVDHNNASSVVRKMIMPKIGMESKRDSAKFCHKDGMRSVSDSRSDKY